MKKRYGVIYSFMVSENSKFLRNAKTLADCCFLSSLIFFFFFAPSISMTGTNTMATATHPGLNVSNIKTFIPIVLELESSQYGSWAELFQIHARAFLVLDHIIPPKPSETAAAPEVDNALWSRIEAIVLQWIYGTISNDLLHTIIEPGSTAQEAWDRLRELFQNNKNSRAVHLEQKFSTIAMTDFPNATAYCQKLKMLADQLANVGAPVSNHRMVLRLVAGLPGEYRNVASQIQHKDPLPLFPVARYMLLLEEDTLNASAAIEASAMVVTADEIMTTVKTGTTKITAEVAEIETLTEERRVVVGAAEVAATSTTVGMAVAARAVEAVVVATVDPTTILRTTAGFTRNRIRAGTFRFLIEKYRNQNRTA
ncbi:hypothetical protein OROGR_026409 [Orobanche gracilis]